MSANTESEQNICPLCEYNFRSKKEFKQHLEKCKAEYLYAGRIVPNSPPKRLVRRKLKLGYEHNLERDKIRSHLKKRGRYGLYGEFKVIKIQDRINKYKPTLKQRQQMKSTQITKLKHQNFTTEELEYIAERFAMSNDPMGQNISLKAKSILT